VNLTSEVATILQCWLFMGILMSKCQH